MIYIKKKKNIKGIFQNHHHEMKKHISLVTQPNSPHHSPSAGGRDAAQSSSSWLSVSRPMTMAFATIKPEMKS